ncbi:MAG: hypothetical protein ACI9S8_000409 [Chlamydiales bacterium]|jgi:hypothetical protein
MTSVGNKAWKIVKGLGLSILSPLAALSIAIPGGIGFGLRSVLLSYNNEVLCALPKGSDVRKVMEENDSLSILTCNVALSESEVMNTANGVLSTKDRVPAMAKFIKRKNPEVLCLQEAFSSRTIYEEMVGTLQEGG